MNPQILISDGRR